VVRRKASGPHHPVDGGARAGIDQLGEQIDPKALTQKSDLAQQPWSAVYDGQRCIGHVLSRGKLGVEAFDAGDVSLGIFPNMKAAANAVSERDGRR
jgi:hypothetical protein